MDKLKSLRPGASKPSYDGASESRSSSTSRISRANLHRPSFDSAKGFISRKIGGDSSPSPTESGTRPISALRDPTSFEPPPKRDPNSPMPQLPARRTTSGSDEGSRAPPPIPSNGKPPVPPRLPPRRDGAGVGGIGNSAGAGTGVFTAPREVTDEEYRSTGGVNTAALDRLAAKGIKIPGFEVSKGITSPPPPPLRPAASTPSLGDRLGGMALGSSTPSPPPTQGTKMEEKKAAAITANKFYKDPGSVSFKDMKSAAGTARNFQQRHGEQVAGGVRTANRLGLGAGILPPPAAAAGPPSPPARGSMPTPPSPSARTPVHTVLGVGKRPPPPPPPKKKPMLPTKGPPPPVPLGSRPPPVPVSSRPPAISPRPSTATPSPSTPCTNTSLISLPNSGIPESEAPALPTDLDLALHTTWFTLSPPRFPPSIANNANKSFAYSTSWQTSPSGRKTHTLILALRWTLNLTLTRVKLSWDASAPTVTVCCVQRHFPPPPPHPLDTLPPVGNAVARWCEGKLGQQVGNGECWTLAHDALKATPGCMASEGYTHGVCIYSHTAGSSSPPLQVDEVKIGDILQFWKATWEWPNGAQKSAGDPNHTAVVTGIRVQGGADEGVVEVLEQNFGGVKTVVKGEYELGSMVKGRCRVFRAVGEEWVGGKLEATWED